jgi:glycosyltransferase involved in cell wall biosynthesis
MNIVFLEPRATGHRMRYLGHLIREAASRGHRVTIGTTEEAHSAQAFEQFVGAHSTSEIALSPGADLNRRSFSQFQIYNWFRSMLARIKSRQSVDLVFVPYLNYIDKLIAIKGSPFGSVPWSGIVMKESFHHHRLGLRPDAERFSSVREKLFLRVLSNKHLRSVITIDEILPEYVNRLSKHSGSLVYVPDPALVNVPLDRNVACERLGLSPERFYLLCYGHIDGRKGIIELLDALRDRAEFSGVSIIIAGRREAAVDEAIRSRIQSSGHGPEVVDLKRFIHPDEEQLLFSVAGAAWVGYKGHFGSSGILGQAAGAGVPVIACESGLIGFTTQRHDLGLCVDIANREAIRAALSRLKDDRKLSETCAAAGAVFSSVRTPAFFSSQILTIVEQNRRMTPEKTNVLIVHNHPIHYKSMLFEALGKLRNDTHVLYVSSSSVIRNKKADLTRERYSLSLASDTAFESFAANVAIFRVINTIRKQRPKILVSCGYHHLAFWASAVTAKLLGIKVVLWYESNEFDHERVIWKESIKRIFMKMCDFAQVYGTSNKEYLVRLGLREDQVSIKMAVVDVPRFKTIQAKIGTRPQRTLIYVGRLSGEKNLRKLVEAINIVNSENRQNAVFLRVVGYGPQEEELKALVARRNMQRQVEFCGPKSQEELKAVFAEGDALILPSIREPWGLTILEAMCAGLPVIASDRCGCTKDVIRPANGWQFEAKSLDSLCDALRNLQQADAAELTAMGAAGRTIAVEYDADNSARRTSHLLTNILGDERGLRKDEQDQTRFVFSR